MSISSDIVDFINSPDTVDFMARVTAPFLEYVHGNPNVVITQILSDRYVLGYIDKSNFSELVISLGSSFINSLPTVLGTLDRPALEASGIIQLHDQPYLNLKGRNTLIGFVDTGIDYTQPVFLYEDGTSKIRYIYDQTLTGEPPKDYFIGREFTNEQINQALRAENPYSVVPQQDEIGHGTLLASIAAGRQVDGFIGAAPDAEIIAVKLKKARPFYLEKYCVPKQQQAAFESSAVMLGIDYIVKKARELRRPVAICLGLGTNFGSHDGYSIFEEYLSSIARLDGVCLCVAAGNESQERHHMTGKIVGAGNTHDIEINVGEQAGDICLSIWNTVADRFSVSLRSPTGELISRVPARPNVITEVKLVLETTRVTIEYHFPVEGSGGQLIIIRILEASSGLWTVILHGDIVLDGSFHAWLPMTGFVSPSVEFLSASPYFTVTVPSTASGVIACGAYSSIDFSLYLQSSWGPSRSGKPLPDLAAPGVNVGGYSPDGFRAISGTSVSTAITAGACALMLQWGVAQGNDVSMSTHQIRAYLIRGCVRNEAFQYPNDQLGYGMLNLMQTFHLMREV